MPKVAESIRHSVAPAAAQSCVFCTIKKTHLHNRRSGPWAWGPSQHVLSIY